jgi:hypothetical protein
MLEAEARGAAIMAIVRLKEGHTGATHMSHQQNTGRGSTAFTRELLIQEEPRKCYRERTRERSLHQQVTGKIITHSNIQQCSRERTRERCLHR